MRSSRHTPQDIYENLIAAEALLAKDQSLPTVSQKLCVSRSTLIKWRQLYRGMSLAQIHSALTLAQQNRELQRKVTHQRVEGRMMRALGQMLTPARRREAVIRICAEVGVSERQACRAVGQHQSTQRYVGVMLIDKKHLTDRIKQLAIENPRYGYRRITALLRREGWQVNPKRVHQIWQDEYLKPRSRRNNLRLKNTKQAASPEMRASRKNEVWAWDITVDEMTSGEPLEWIALVDEFTRECLALEVREQIEESLLVELLDQASHERTTPRYLRSDNGQLFTSTRLLRHLESQEIQRQTAMPGKPWANGVVESFFARLRDELLSCEVFASLKEAQNGARFWREHYNESRPHGSLNHLTPLEFAALEPHVEAIEKKLSSASSQ